MHSGSEIAAGAACFPRKLTFMNKYYYISLATGSYAYKNVSLIGGEALRKTVELTFCMVSDESRSHVSDNILFPAAKEMRILRTP